MAVYEPLKLKSIKTEWILNQTYNDCTTKPKAIIKKDACMKFYIKKSHYTSKQYIHSVMGVFEPLRLKSIKKEWMLNQTYNDLYN